MKTVLRCAVATLALAGSARAALAQPSAPADLGAGPTAPQPPGEPPPPKLRIAPPKAKTPPPPYEHGAREPTEKDQRRVDE